MGTDDLGQDVLARTLLPVGELTKDDVRARAAALGLRTAAKPDSQDVCFITRGGRGSFLTSRLEMTPARVIDTSGVELGRVDAVELVTIGQRRGVGLAGGSAPRYVVDIERDTVTVGTERDLLVDEIRVHDLVWVDESVADEVLVQCSAHGAPRPATIDGDIVRFTRPERRVAPGQSVVVYRGESVLGGGIAARDRSWS